MRIAIMGTGGVGGYFGARLAQAGHDVAFVARGAHLAAILTDGLTIETGAGAETLHVRATDDPTTIGPVDIVLFAVKLWDTISAAEAVRPLVGPETAVVSFQNGVVKEDEIAGVLGADHVVGGASYIAAVIKSPGVIALTGALARLQFGERDGSRSARVEAFHAACVAAGIDATVSPDIELTIWEKFVFLCGMSGMTTLTRQPIGVLRANAQTRGLALDAMREVVAVGRAKGVGLSPTFAEDRIAFADTLPWAMNSSMAGDLARGNRLELPWLAGTVVRFGHELGVPTPVNRVIFDALAPYVDGAPAGPPA
jgi:2-dehydropantoate 2-reductase